MAESMGMVLEKKLTSLYIVTKGITKGHKFPLNIRSYVPLFFPLDILPKRAQVENPKGHEYLLNIISYLPFLPLVICVSSEHKTLLSMYDDVTHAHESRNFYDYNKSTPADPRQEPQPSY